jgi:hypothetical protein
MMVVWLIFIVIGYLLALMVFPVAGNDVIKFINAKQTTQTA